MYPYKLLNTITLYSIALLISSCSVQKNANVKTSSSDQMNRARELAHQTLITDGHIDFPYRFRAKYGTIHKTNAQVAIDSEAGEFDFERCRTGGLDAPFMSIYIPASYQEKGGAKELADSLIDFVHALIDLYPGHFGHGRSPDEINSNFEKGLVSLPMGMENGAPIGLDLDRINYFYDRGIRYITLAHSKWNQICDSSYDPERKWNGLSPFGYQVVERMNNTGIMIDVSHISDSAFYDVMESTRTPVIASHSSCRIFTPDFERNMSDDMIRSMKENEGVVQINFGSTFLDGTIANNRTQFAADWDKYKAEKGGSISKKKLDKQENRFKKDYPLPLFANVQTVADHIDHVVKIAGIDHVGLGSDFDGVGDSLPEGLKDVSQYPNLIAELLNRGYNEEEIAKICYKNVWRVWKAVEDYAHSN